MRLMFDRAASRMRAGNFKTGPEALSRYGGRASLPRGVELMDGAYGTDSRPHRHDDLGTYVRGRHSGWWRRLRISSYVRFEAEEGGLIWKHIFEESPLSDVTPHILRHSFARGTRPVASGGPRGPRGNVDG